MFQAARTTALSLLSAVVLSAGVAWYLMRPTPVPPLADNWDAVVTVLAGDGIAGLGDGSASRARFSDPFGIAAAAEGTLFVADGAYAHRIRRIAVDGMVSTLAGSERGWMDGSVSSARFDTPSGVAVGSDGSVYVADTGNNAVRRISTDGMVTTVAGAKQSGFEDGLGNAARFNGPLGVAALPGNRIVVADTYNDRIRLVEPDGRVRTLAGTGVAGLVDGPAPDSRFDTPSGVAVDSAGVVYVADTGNNVVRRIANDQVTTLAPLTGAELFRPTGIAVNSTGTLFVVDEGGRVVEIRQDLSTRVLAGSRVGFSDGPGENARFRAPSGIALAGPTTLIVTDRRNALIRVIEPRGHGTSHPPASPRVSPRFDFDGFALTPLLWPVHPQEGPFEITGTMGEMRGGDGEERFHAGLDVRAADGTPVRVVRDGVVTEPIATTDFNTLNEALRIGPLVYVHQRVGRTRTAVYRDARLAPIYDEQGTLVRMRVKRGSRYSVGEDLGTTNAFNHVHLNIGWPREEHNPLAARLVQFTDTIQPTIVRGGIHLLDPSGKELKQRVRGRLLVSGPVRIVVDAWDQADGNRPQRRLGLYRLGFQVLRADGNPASGFEETRERLRFDRLFPDANAARLTYAPGSGIPFFGGRRTRFLYEVTNEVRNGVATEGVWDTDALPPGNYTLRILATDFSGNIAIGNRDLPVVVGGVYRPSAAGAASP